MDECDRCIWKLVMDDPKARETANYPDEKCPGWSCFSNKCSSFNPREGSKYVITEGAYYGAYIEEE